VKVRFEDDTGVHEKMLLLKDRTSEFPLGAQGKVRWLLANADCTGMYRVGYDAADLQRLLQNAQALTPLERSQLLTDISARVRAGRADVSEVFSVMESLKNEQDPTVVSELINTLTIFKGFTEERTRSAYAAKVRELLGPKFEALGWEPQEGESSDTRILRGALIQALGSVGEEPSVIQEAQRRARRFLDGDKTALSPDMRDAAFSLVDPDEALLDELIRRIRDTNDPLAKDAIVRRMFIQTLAQAKDPRLADRVVRFAIDGTVPLGELASFAFSLVDHPPTLRAFWSLMQKEWPAFESLAQGAPKVFSSVLMTLAWLDGKQYERELAHFFANGRYPNGERTLTSVRDQLNLVAGRKERLVPQMEAWFQKKGTG
jgi:puromycin-sensitive aminopeptidase